MAKECSFDIVSEYNKQELVNAIDQVKRELTSRFNLKNSNYHNKRWNEIKKHCWYSSIKISKKKP